MMLPSSVHRTRPKLAHFTSVKSIQHSTAHGILTLRKPLHTFGEYLPRLRFGLLSESTACSLLSFRIQAVILDFLVQRVAVDS